MQEKKFFFEGKGIGTLVLNIFYQNRVVKEPEVDQAAVQRNITAAENNLLETLAKIEEDFGISAPLDFLSERADLITPDSITSMVIDQKIREIFSEAKIKIESRLLSKINQCDLKKVLAQIKECFGVSWTSEEFSRVKSISGLVIFIKSLPVKTLVKTKALITEYA